MKCHLFQSNRTSVYEKYISTRNMNLFPQSISIPGFIPIYSHINFNSIVFRLNITFPNALSEYAWFLAKPIQKRRSTEIMKWAVCHGSVVIYIFWWSSKDIRNRIFGFWLWISVLMLMRNKRRKKTINEEPQKHSPVSKKV